LALPRPWQLSPEIFDKFVELAGEENLRWLTLAERQWPDGSCASAAKSWFRQKAWSA
jgi:hypothetical protein